MIESALKAAFNKRRESKLQDLITQARSHSDKLMSFDESDLNEFRNIRNEITHYGYSPKDDERTAVSLLKVGFRFLAGCYEEFFGFSLSEGLIIEFSSQLAIAEEVYSKATGITGLNLLYCFLAFGHLIRWSVKDSFMSHWELKASISADECGEKFTTCEDLASNLEFKYYDASWRFDRPICSDIEAFVCDLDGSRLDEGIITIKRAQCVCCGLQIPCSCPFLADALCRDEIERERTKILQDYGIGTG